MKFIVIKRSSLYRICIIRFMSCAVSHPS